MIKDRLCPFCAKSTPTAVDMKPGLAGRMLRLDKHSNILIYRCMNNMTLSRGGQAARRPRKKGQDETAAGAAAAETFLKALANRHRLLLLCSLIDGEAAVGDLARRLGLSQPAVSQHLAKMRVLGLVTARREGTMIYYGIGDAAVAPIVDALYRKFCS
jgi:DNA-binding transcriptional ArsR family regulator